MAGKHDRLANDSFNHLINKRAELFLPVLPSFFLTRLKTSGFKIAVLKFNCDFTLYEMNLFSRWNSWQNKLSAVHSEECYESGFRNFTLNEAQYKHIPR